MDDIADIGAWYCSYWY